MTSVSRELGTEVSVERMCAVVARAFGHVFALEPREISREMLEPAPR
jgi:hypothetical protein